jgi:transposase
MIRCVCPMGGDRECPASCPLAVWAGLSLTDRKAQRKPVAEKLYQQGFTMEQIATQLSVSAETISQDLKGFQETGKPPRPKGGRPKGSKKSRHVVPTPHKMQDQVTALMDEGKTVTEIANLTDVGKRQVRHIVERVEIERAAKAEPNINRAELSLSAQAKLDIAIRQHKKKLDIAFEQRVRDEATRRVDEIVLPHWKKQIAQAEKLYAARKGLMDKETFNTIRRGLHPDSRNSISDKKLGEAFDTFMGLEKYLLNEKDSPTEFGNVPSTLAEWDKLKMAAQQSRRMKTAQAVRRA